MDVKESYRVLELEIGASRVAVDAAYCRLIERWHPDRAASSGPEAVREAQRMVQAINDAYQTLAKIAPDSAKPSPPLPPSAAPAAGAKPTLKPLPAGQPAPSRPPPPRLPPPETWAARSAPVSSAPPPPPATSTPPPAPTPNPMASAPETTAAQSTSSSDLRSKAVTYYDTLFPVASPWRRFGPYILAAALVFVLLLGKCAFSSLGSKSREEAKAAKVALEARTTSRLLVKSNRTNTTIEATRITSGSEAASASVNGTDEGATEQALSGLLPGKYLLKARSTGWPEIRQEVDLDAGRTIEVAINFKSGSLRLDSVPTGARVRWGGAELGRTPLVIPQLPPGECQLAIEYPFWPVATLKTTITENVESSETVRLPHGKLILESTPTGATVRQGGGTLGQTPLTLEHVPAGTNKFTLQAKDFPTLMASIVVKDGAEMKVNLGLGFAFPELDPSALLRVVWVPDNPDSIAPPFEGITDPSAPRNGIVKNLNRKRLFEYWLRKSYHFSAIVKSYDRDSGQVEFAEQKSELSKYRLLAKLSPNAINDKDLVAQLIKGATVAFYGRLSAVEEPRWPSKVITFEISSVEPLR
jgi:hypothetical protein